VNQVKKMNPAPIKNNISTVVNLANQVNTTNRKNNLPTVENP
jgi:hypothetical protein